MKVLYCVSEVAPLIKVGGLGDVAGSLPKALSKLGVEIAIVVPAYEEILTRIGTNIKAKKHQLFDIEFAGKKDKVVVWQTNLPESTVPVYLLENERYLSKNGHQAFTGKVSEIERFAFFSKSIAEFVKVQTRGCGLEVDLLHLNDWHTSLVPLLLSAAHHLPSVLTIHNLSYQGVAGIDLLEKLGLQEDSCGVLKWDSQNRDLDILMEGIIHATLVNTVSPTYSKEILTPEFGGGIEEILKGREGRIAGILNGIDYEVWNPALDRHLVFNYEPAGANEGKSANKKFLQKELKLAGDEKIPLLAFIGRLEPKQKGLDILYEALGQLLPGADFQLVILGTGDKRWEEQFSNLASQQTNNFRFISRFDEKLAHRIYAGADLILMPSKFEPCGLPQMIGMRYGTLPLVRKTGGLADTVREGKTGFVFEEYSGKALAEKINQAVKAYHQPNLWQEMITEAVKQDFSWEKSAGEYLELYERALKINL